MRDTPAHAIPPQCKKKDEKKKEEKPRKTIHPHPTSHIPIDKERFTIDKSLSRQKAFKEKEKKKKIHS